MGAAMIKIKEEHKVIIFTVLAAALVWTADAAYDAWIEQRGPFFRMLLNVTHHEPFLRLFMILCFLVFGVVISRILSRHNRAEQALKRQSAAIESSMDGIAIYDASGEYVYVNQAYASINGYDDPAELIGKTYRVAYDEKEVERIEQVRLPVLMKGGRWRGELIAKRKNGSTYFQEASVTLLEDGGRVCIIRDITWRKRSDERLRRSERFLNMIFNSIRDPFCIFDSEFRVIRANAAYAAMKNKRVEDLIGRKCYEVLADRDRVCEGCVVEQVPSILRPLRKGKADQAPRTATQLGGDLHLSHPGRGRQSDPCHRVHAGHHGAQKSGRGKGAFDREARIPVADGQPHGADEQAGTDGQAPLRGRPREAVQVRTFPDPLRHRQLQGDQRHLRT